ncbi:zinc ribbon domain-containing protein [Streptomyces sp. NRRL S-1824]|uniref:zinc ribbon domain-containing protein n=1 Tax=Streptomyces sp. NRRL S-1824 TaxID=1463889 RepID=UPI003B63FFD3
MGTRGCTYRHVHTFQPRTLRSELDSIHWQSPSSRPYVPRRRADPGSRPGCGRSFTCVNCGHEDDADHNASVEIEARACRTGGSVTNSTRRRPTAPSPVS